MRAMRKEARALLTWCLAQRGPFTRGDCAADYGRDVSSIRDGFARFVTLGYLDCEIDGTNHYSYMVINRPAAIEATQQEAKKAYWIEAQRRLRLKEAKAPRRVVNSVFQLGM